MNGNSLKYFDTASTTKIDERVLTDSLSKK